MDERVAAAWQVLPEYLGEHVVLSAAALALGLALSLVLTIAAVRSPRVRWPVLLLASIVQTIPGLALLALFYPLLLALSALSQRLLGHGFSALGFLPSLLALALYSMLPVIRNGVTGILNLDPALIEAARGVGMTDWQRLKRVELPLAAPMLMAGVRTAAVWVIGAATLSTPVGQTSLGNYIFSGLQVQNWVSVLFGCVAAAALALIVDQLLGLIESGVTTRRRARIAIGALALAAGVAAAAVPRGDGAAGSYVIGAKNFSEQYILSALIVDRIAEEGGVASRRVGLGSAIVFNALAAGDIDAYVDYSGTIWANVMRRTDVPPTRSHVAGDDRVARARARNRASRRTRLRERLRARDASRSRRAARDPHDCRSRGALAPTHDGLGSRVLRAARVAGPARRVMASTSPRAASSSRRSCIKPSRPAKWTSSRRSRATAESPRTISSCSTIRAARSCRTMRSS